MIRLAHPTPCVLAFLTVLMALTLCGCAPTVRAAPGAASATRAADEVRSTAPSAAAAPAAARNLVLVVTGSDALRARPDWDRMVDAWARAMADAAQSSGAALEVRDTPPRAGGAPGTLLLVEVLDYRYVSLGARLGGGADAGRATVRARVRFRDLTSGAVRGERTYSSASSNYQETLAPGTMRQLRAIGRRMLADLHLQ